MGTGNLETAGITVIKQDVDQYESALTNDFVGRDSGGVPKAGQRLGTPIYPWGQGYFDAIFVAGSLLDVGIFTSKSNRVVSGQTRSTSSQVDFLKAAGSGLNAEIQGEVVNLLLSINGESTTITTDISITGITAAPSSGNTALVNDTSLTGQISSKYQGERDTTLTIDTLGAEWTASIGKVIAVKVGSSSEILIGTLKSSTELVNCYRGYFFDSSGDPLVRSTISNNDTLTLLSVAWVFANDDAVGFGLTYNAPYFSGEEPDSPIEGDYWLDLSVQAWKRFESSNWVQSDRTLIGTLVSDQTDCIGSRSLDPYITYDGLNNVLYKYDSATQIISRDVRGEVAVYGDEYDFDLRRLIFDIETDLESPLTEQASTTYYGYLDSLGNRFLSDERPYNRPDLQGLYHPYNSWRYQFEIFNDGSSDFDPETVKTESPFLLDEDDFLSNDPDRPSSQKSVKSLADRVAINEGKFDERIYGAVASDGTIEDAGSGNWTASRASLGVYSVTFDTPRSSAIYTVLTSGFVGAQSGLISITSTTIRINTFNVSTGAQQDARFTFLSIGEG